MRTTVTIDDDIAHLLEAEIRRSGATFKDALNRYLRLGLAAAKQPPRKKFKVKPRMLGLPPGLSYDKVEELIEALEGPYHR